MPVKELRILGTKTDRRLRGLAWFKKKEIGWKLDEL
jgi:hypothetical protein